VRFDVLSELARLGFRRMVVEKPLATSVEELERIGSLREHFGVRIAVVAHWLYAELTARLHDLVLGHTLGPLRTIRFVQHKPRFHRSIVDSGHTTAFDVEIPHSLGVVLLLAGAAELSGAQCLPMRVGRQTLPGMGCARLTLLHSSGVASEIVSDLASPVQERSVRLGFESGSAVGHYPLSDRDNHAQLAVTGQTDEHTVFPDDAFTSFTLRTYESFRDDDPALDDAFHLHGAVVRLCCAAKQHCLPERRDAC
jgi:predicted dehydrogenase